MDRLDGVLQPSPWGDRQAFVDLVGVPADGPALAELWLGAHPRGPSRLVADGRTLDVAIAADAPLVLGRDVASRFGELPYLFKVLAAARPLSIQTHPDAEQARVGFDREEAAGVPIDAPERIYRDPHHKPELVCAVSPFEAKCGFRRLAGTRRLFERLDDPRLDPVRQHLAAPGTDAEVLAATTAWLLHRPRAEAARLVAGAVAGSASGPEGFEADAAWCARIASGAPDDPGVVVALLLNHVVLNPGQALELGAGNLHAYLRGTAMELMANSDNVVRGGLTDKHVDVDELLRVATFEPLEPQIETPSAPIHHYRAAAEELSLTRAELDGDLDRPGGRPEIVFVAEGEMRLASAVEQLDLHQGQAAFVGAVDGPYRISGHGLAFVASTGN